jgi:RNA polymerase sigma factor (sigma-70 family)
MENAADVPETGHTDEALVERVRDCDGAAFDTLFGRYFVRIYRFVKQRLGKPADVEETVQEVLVDLFSSLDAFRGEAPFAAWVLGLTRRVLANRFERTQAATVPPPIDAAEQAAPALDPRRDRARKRSLPQ